MKSNIKFYKNPNRNIPDQVKKYTPQYQLLGIEPEKVTFASRDNSTPVKKVNPTPDNLNPRTRQFGTKVPYAEKAEPLVGVGRSVLPNVGNNMEQSWVGVDGEIVDDLENVDSNHQMIDNNDFVSGVNYEGRLNPPKSQEAHNKSPQQMKSENLELIPIIKDLDNDSYLLIVNEVVLCSGPLEEIQEQVSALVFGEHDLCQKGIPFSPEDILVLKKIKIKIGVFIER